MTLSYDSGQVLPFETALEHKYAVWAMVKNPQQHHHSQAQDDYISENQVVAEFNTVSLRETEVINTFVYVGGWILVSLIAPEETLRDADGNRAKRVR